MPVNYNNSKIYAIRSHQTDDIYIGSTCQPLSKRMGEHRRDYKRYLGGKYHFVSSFEILKHGDSYIELVEEYPCGNKEQLLRREGELIREMDCINKNVAGRTLAEYYAANRDKRLAYQNNYYEANRDKLLDIKNCECGGKYARVHKSRHEKSKKHQQFVAAK